MSFDAVRSGILSICPLQHPEANRPSFKPLPDPLLLRPRGVHHLVKTIQSACRRRDSLRIRDCFITSFAKTRASCESVQFEYWSSSEARHVIPLCSCNSAHTTAADRQLAKCSISPSVLDERAINVPPPDQQREGDDRRT